MSPGRRLRVSRFAGLISGSRWYDAWLRQVMLAPVDGSHQQTTPPHAGDA
jgi:hypothetical protein